MTLDLPGCSPAKPFRVVPLSIGGDGVKVRDEEWSSRLRCDHPEVEDGEALGEALLQEAEARGRGRVVVLAHRRLLTGFQAAGYTLEAIMPGFYRGEADCAVLGAYPDPRRGRPATPEEVEDVERLLEGVEPVQATPDATTSSAGEDDLEAMASLLGDTFTLYPTPSSDPEYLSRQLEDGTPFRVVKDEGDIVALASADLVPPALNAELTDCATRPSHRGKGLMQALLVDLVEDLQAMGYTGAFTLARARVPGVNIAFKRLGFAFRGRMNSSCRIGEGLEDMNVWSRPLQEP